MFCKGFSRYRLFCDGIFIRAEALFQALCADILFFRPRSPFPLKFSGWNKQPSAARCRNRQATAMGMNVPRRPRAHATVEKGRWLTHGVRIYSQVHTVDRVGIEVLSPTVFVSRGAYRLPLRVPSSGVKIRIAPPLHSRYTEQRRSMSPFFRSPRSSVARNTPPPNLEPRVPRPFNKKTPTVSKAKRWASFFYTRVF